MPTWDDLIKQRGANFKLIEELVEHGSNVEMLHECKHHFYSSDLSALQQLSEKAKIFRYSISKIGSEKKETGDLYCFLDIIISVSLDPRLILFDNIGMLELAEEYGAEYDGWGAVVNDRT